MSTHRFILSFLLTWIGLVIIGIKLGWLVMFAILMCMSGHIYEKHMDNNFKIK